MDMEFDNFQAGRTKTEDNGSAFLKIQNVGEVEKRMD